ncbi:hypothetical protein KIPE111705_39580 [Kibdelosporangium persicum]|uniref:Proteins of 100 residues with WXG n=1 Tax=Kibdelosporangium persicum TaxID=2698649 RepID=A0ABX2FC83_9PSEU|nr:hypothetical protein [Kibdelosporangium persicum]NRN68744.1 hypothetical protein [Kibdelosporangium persicum]
MSLKGADVKGMRQIASFLKRAADIAENVLNVAQRILDALSMAGPWAQSFKAYLRTLIAFMRKVIAALKKFTEILTANAQEQADASTRPVASGGGSAQGGSPAAAPKQDALGKLTSTLEKINKLGEELGKFQKLFQQSEQAPQVQNTPQAPTPPSLDTTPTAPRPTVAGLPDAIAPTVGTDPPVERPIEVAGGGTLGGSPDGSASPRSSGGPDGSASPRLSGGGGGGLANSAPPPVDEAGDLGELQVARTTLGPHGAILAASGAELEQRADGMPVSAAASRTALPTAAAVLGASAVLAGGGRLAMQVRANRADAGNEQTVQLGRATLPS